MLWRLPGGAAGPHAAPGAHPPSWGAALAPGGLAAGWACRGFARARPGLTLCLLSMPVAAESWGARRGWARRGGCGVCLETARHRRMADTVTAPSCTWGNIMVDPGMSPCDGNVGPRVQAGAQADVHGQPGAEPAALGAPRAAPAPRHGLSLSWCVPGVGSAALRLWVPGKGVSPGTGVAASTHPQSHCVPRPVAQAAGWPLGFPRLAATAPAGTRPGALLGQLLQHPWGARADRCLGAGRSGINFPQKQDTAGEPAGLLPLPGKRSRGWGWERAGGWLCRPGGSLLWG